MQERDQGTCCGRNEGGGGSAIKGGGVGSTSKAVGGGTTTGLGIYFWHLGHSSLLVQNVLDLPGSAMLICHGDLRLYILFHINVI